MRDLNAHPDFFVPFERRRRTHEYFDQVETLLPPAWRLKQEHFWTQAMRPSKPKRVQGWKIHVSATIATAASMLDKVVPACIASGTEFKFATDPGILRHLLGKNCKRSQSGKFITIYPDDTPRFTSLLAELHELTAGADGPYVLSDRQYRDSRVLYYRYGGFRSLADGDEGMERKAYIVGADFELVEDERNPFFRLPGFIAGDPCLEPVATDGAVAAGPRVFGDAFEIDEALKFSNFGGVYAGRNTVDGAAIVLKEARPHVGGSRHTAVEVLQREHRLLALLAGTGIAPRPVGLFQEWTHWFLAQERVPGVTLKEFGARHGKLTHAGTSDQDMRTWCENMLVIARNLLDVVDRLHGHGIVFGDLSANNVMVEPETMVVRLIDFEGAHQPGVDPDVNVYTPGYAPRERYERDSSTFADDIHALGCLLLAMLMPNTPLMGLKPDYGDLLVREVIRDIGLPRVYADCVQALLSGKADLAAWQRRLAEADLDGVHGFGAAPPESRRGLERFCDQVAAGFTRFCDASLDLRRGERVLPLGPGLESALAVDKGIAGVAYAWHAIAGAVPGELSDWLRRKARHGEGRRPPGLLDGSSGAAWVFAELGHEVEARAELRRAAMHRGLYRSMSWGYGAAGYGHACLRFWQRYGDEADLRQAVRIGDLLAATVRIDGSGASWDAEDPDAGVPVGLHEGSAGVALFLLRLHAATGDRRHLDLGAEALRHDMAFARSAGTSLGFPRWSRGSILYPYHAHGSAGVAAVALRYHAATGAPELEDLVRRSVGAAANKYALGAGLFTGIAGLGNYLLDVADFLGDAHARELALRSAAGIRLFAVEREAGIAFPDSNALKLNSDYESGSAGVALFLRRLAHGGGNFDFMIDDPFPVVRASEPEPKPKPLPAATAAAAIA